MNKRKWMRHWNILKRFSPGLRSGSVFNINHPKDAGDTGVGPEEAYWFFQEKGKLITCTNSEKMTELLERKSCMDLTISMWKDTILDMQKSSSTRDRVLIPQSFVLELCGEYPVSFLQSTGILKMVGLTIRQCGMRLMRLPKKN